MSDFTYREKNIIQMLVGAKTCSENPGIYAIQIILPVILIIAVAAALFNNATRNKMQENGYTPNTIFGIQMLLFILLTAVIVLFCESWRVKMPYCPA